MLEFYNDIVNFIGDFFIRGSFISVFVIILAKLIFKTRIDFAAQILKWLIIIYAIGVVVNFLLAFTFLATENWLFIKRSTGTYWWAYWFMLISNSVLPLLLLINKIGNKLYFLLFVTIVMNAGWLFESFVIHVSSFYRDYSNLYLLSEREYEVILQGIVFGILLIVIGNSAKWYSSRKV